MANITQYTDAIQNAVYGEQVRGSIIDALDAINSDSDAYSDLLADVYATFVINSTKTFANVPTSIKPKVKQLLIDLDHSDLITE